MGGDLNLKKSWHPVLMSNQRRVWEEEKKALDERKRIEQMMKERQEERQVQELQEMQEAAGGTKRLNRVDWMYSGPSSGQVGTTEEMEGYLLGKRRIDGLIKGSENKKLQKSASEDSFMALQNANTIRDTASKIREDPMLAIKKQEQAAYEALMNDPVRRRLLLKAAGHDIKLKNNKDRGHRKHKHREERDDHHSHKHKDRRQDSRDDLRLRRRHRRRSFSSSRSRSPKPYRRRSESPRRNRNRSVSPYPTRRRSRSPYRRSRSPYRISRSPERPRTDHQQSKHRNGWHSTGRNKIAPNSSAPTTSTADDRAAKLAAMQEAATVLDREREGRINAVENREKIEREMDEAARLKSAKYGGKGDFVNGLNRKAGALNIGERMRRGRGGLEKDFDD